MAHYPTTEEIVATLDADTLAALVASLPSYHTSPVDIVTLNLPTVTPEILTAFAALIKAVRAEYPTATATTSAISRPKTQDELVALAVQPMQSETYNRELDAEKAEAEKAK
jgi:hypothetical protein